MTFSKTIKKSAGSFPIRLQNPGIFLFFLTTKWIQGKTAKIGCGLFGVSKKFYNINTLTYWLLRYRFSYRILHQEGGGSVKNLPNPCKHRFAGIFILSEMQKKASKSGLPVAYSVYFFPGRESTPNCS